MQCLIDRVPHTMAFDYSKMVNSGNFQVPPRHRRESTPLPSDCEARMPLGSPIITDSSPVNYDTVKSIGSHSILKTKHNVCIT